MEEIDATTTSDDPPPTKRQRVSTPPPGKTPIATPDPESSDESTHAEETPGGPPIDNGPPLSQEGEIEITHTNLTNANVIFPHPRHLCEVVSMAKDPSGYCPKCFCFVCDIPASDCSVWTIHCAAIDNGQWKKERKNKKQSANVIDILSDEDEPEVRVKAPTSKFENKNVDKKSDWMFEDPAKTPQEEHTQAPSSHVQKPASQMTTRELLMTNLKQVMETTRMQNSYKNHHQIVRKMEGDIPQLTLHNSFYVEGIKVGWPFPMVMPPQRQMAIHIIKALKQSKHVVLESPTGTGKSAAILCSCLAWQRFFEKTRGRGAEGDASTGRPQIIYASRTHSQVAQMVSSLKKTPYRPQMAILGSRDRLCIHKKIRPRDKSNQEDRPKASDANNECRTRTKNTEKFRKKDFSHSRNAELLQKYNGSRGDMYDDDHPPGYLPGDDMGPKDNPTKEKEFTCPHYRQLTSNRIAQLAHSALLPSPSNVNAVLRGGEHTRMGTHDIEDLISFGKNPTIRSAALYRDPGETSFGMSLTSSEGGNIVLQMKKDGAAKKEGTIGEGDFIVGLNGRNVRDWPFDRVVTEIKNTVKDPLFIDVVEPLGVGADDAPLPDPDEYSPDAPCPYYLSQALSKHAEIVFCPYNYLLDKKVRESLGIDLTNSVVVLDEAHNVEGVLQQSGSGKFGEMELCELIVMFTFYAGLRRSKDSQVEIPQIDPITGAPSDSKEMDLCELSHNILIFVEKIVLFLITCRTKFQDGKGSNSAEAAIREYQSFKVADTNEFESMYFGPTGHGVMNQPIGCKLFFEQIGITVQDLENVSGFIGAFSQHVTSSGRSGESSERDRSVTLMDGLVEFVEKLLPAFQTPEHYYICINVIANGNLEWASGNDEPIRFKAKPKALPKVGSDNMCGMCPSRTPHGSFCDGSIPRWQASLSINLLNPGLFMEELTSQCRTVILASGTLSPIPSLCGELNLLPPNPNPVTANLTPIKASPKAVSGEDPSKNRRLQIHPKPLQANHVINLDKQLLAVSIGCFPDGHPLTVNHKNYSKPGYLAKLGVAIATVIESIPTGGVLVFLPSYSLLKKCVREWNPEAGFPRSWRGGGQDTNVWDRLIRSKHKVIAEPTGSQDLFEAARDEYADTIKNEGSCILLAVFRGKMSEGVSFNDENARAVICIGIPYPSFASRDIQAKKAYNDEQRKLRKRTDILPGDEWYKMQAYRALAQALGRCIRHAADYGTVILMDSRHCHADGDPVNNEGISYAHQHLPKWMRGHVRTVSTNRKSAYSHMPVGAKKSIQGWPGLKAEMKTFFKEAPIQSKTVLEAQRARFLAATEKEKKSVDLSFDRQRGTWITKNKTPCASGCASSGCGTATPLKNEKPGNQFSEYKFKNK